MNRQEMDLKTGGKPGGQTSVGIRRPAMRPQSRRIGRRRPLIGCLGGPGKLVTHGG